MKIGIETVPAAGLFQPIDLIMRYKQPYLTEDPSFGIVCEDGVIEDLMDEEKCALLRESLSERRKQQTAECSAILVFGYGSGSRKLDDLYDLYYYFDYTDSRFFGKCGTASWYPLALRAVIRTITGKNTIT